MSPLSHLLPIDAAAHGPTLDRHLMLNLTIAFTLLAITHLILLVGLIGTRTAKPRRLWAIESLPLAALILLFAFLTLRAEHLWAATRYTGADPAALQVEVTGVQFAWYFRYPGRDALFGRTAPQLVDAPSGNPLGLDPADAAATDDVLSSELVLPANREVDLRLEAQDVIHGFSVPSLRVKQNAIPGQTQHIHLTPTLPGTYAILCTQLCGLGHYRMAANLRVLPEAEYQKWLQTKEAR